MRSAFVSCAVFLAALPPATARAQDNYEIQVYGASVVPARRTMVELHSNFTAEGRTGVVDSLLPTEHAFHETLERRAFSTDTWTWEIRPIVDQQLGRWYWAINPALEKAVVGENAARGWEFSPNAALSYDLSRAVTAALEYYGAFGPLSGFDPAPEQQHQLFAAVDLNVSPLWEINLGVGRGFTAATDHLLLKTIFGYRLPF